MFDSVLLINPYAISASYMLCQVEAGTAGGPHFQLFEKLINISLTGEPQKSLLAQLECAKQATTVVDEKNSLLASFKRDGLDAKDLVVRLGNGVRAWQSYSLTKKELAKACLS